MNSTALKIHISLETKILLDINGSFVTEHRGAIEIKVGSKNLLLGQLQQKYNLTTKFSTKGMLVLVDSSLQGKGMVDTYWLNGREGGLGRSNDS